MPNKTITFGADLLPNGNLTYSLGNADNNWIFNGSLSVTTLTAPSSSKTYYPWFSTCSTGTLLPYAHPAFYIYEAVSSSTITKTFLNVGSLNVGGGLTLHAGQGTSDKYGNLVVGTLSTTQTYTLPDYTGTVAIAINSGSAGQVLKMNNDTEPEWAEEYKIEIIRL